MIRFVVPVILSLFFASPACAALGFFGSYIFMDANGSFQIYDLTAPGGARASDPTDFDGFNLGSFNPAAGNTLAISGAEGLTFKNGSSDVFGANLNYSVVPTGGSHAFSEVAIGFTSNASFNDAAGTSYGGSGDQKWSDSGAWAPIDILGSLSNGTYEIQVFLRGTSNEGDFFHNNAPTFANYTATFSVIPEPTTLVMFGSAALCLLRRRR
ncbi:MAG: PEP-CTERM sorting domain-containing protein [Planctomycetota bacterium]